MNCTFPRTYVKKIGVSIERMEIVEYIAINHPNIKQ
jgi:hypothetical protein